MPNTDLIPSQPVINTNIYCTSSYPPSQMADAQSKLPCSYYICVYHKWGLINFALLLLRKYIHDCLELLGGKKITNIFRSLVCTRPKVTQLLVHKFLHWPDHVEDW